MSGERWLTGWGRTARSRATVLDGGDDPTLLRALRDAGDRGLIARGMGRAYGDAACNAGGAVLDMTTRARILGWDDERGTVTVEAGVDLARLTAAAVRRGLFPAVLPGTGQVSVGGAIAADIHGKNHHAAGGFCAHVTSLDLLTADATVVRVSPRSDPDLFHATAGGMGLTGPVLRATLRLARVDGPWMVATTERAGDLAEVMSRLASADGRHPYSVAWVDLCGASRTGGRGVVSSGRHADPGEASGRGEPGTHHVGVPPGMPAGLVNRRTVSAFNELWYRRSPRTPRVGVEHSSAFFHPLDALANWNRLYGRRGFVQYQFVVPFGAEPVLRLIAMRVAGSGQVPALAVLKRLGAAGPGMLSFPMPGWTLAVDLAVADTLGPLLDDFDHRVAEAGGRVYLAKDARMRPDVLAAMYPRIDAFRALRRRVDPRGVFASDLSRRLSL